MGTEGTVTLNRKELLKGLAKLKVRGKVHIKGTKLKYSGVRL
jgi:hypothetical protein